MPNLEMATETNPDFAANLNSGYKDRVRSFSKKPQLESDSDRFYREDQTEAPHD